MLTLDQLPHGRLASIVEITGEDPVVTRLMEMGLLPGTEVRFVRRAPLGDPMEVEVRGFHLSLRAREAACIGISID